MDNRREFLKKAVALGGGLAFLEPLQRALAINPDKGSTYLDAEHVVFLMQENRSFDHAFGTLRGVRGFNDPRAITLPNGNPVWLQTNHEGQTFPPFRLDIKDTKATWMNSLPHSWSNQTDARNEGKMDRWLDVKKGEFPQLPMTMGYYNREDIPFYYALADAFTVCDQNFCSSLTGTTPNRLYFWTGAIRADKNDPARVYNDQTDYPYEAGWTTFPERLEAAGISWKVYQNEVSIDSGFTGEQDPWLANFTDNPLEWFTQYRIRFAESHRRHKPDAGYTDAAWDALTQHEKNLHEKAFTTNKNDPHYRELTSLTYTDGQTQRTVEVPKGDTLHQFRKDVEEGKLPAVSWLVAPEHYSDHPGSAWYGTWYVSEALDILTKNPEVWKKTIFILTYDENDGSFDHVPPFVAPHPHRDDTGKVSRGIDTTPEWVYYDQDFKPASEPREGPIGLGFRVPLVVASPWTKGGYVNSEVFDHTSSLRFLESFIAKKWNKHIVETNITDWRRTVAGDLTSVFRPYNGERITEPPFQDKDRVIEDIHKAQFRGLPQAPGLPYVPFQEKGTRPSNALAYELFADGYLDKPSGEFVLTLRTGSHSLGAPFSVYAPGEYLQTPRVHGKPEGAPVMSPVKTWSYAVATNDSLGDRFPLAHFAGGTYHLRVYGPNGFYREFKGNAQDPDVKVMATYTRSGGLSLVFETGDPLDVTITDHGYGQNNKQFHLEKGGAVDLDTTQGWYDVSVRIGAEYTARFAGRVETGKDSISDPVMGGVLAS